MKLKILAAFWIILSLQAGQKTAAQMDDGSFTVFCTGNHDSTGSCLEVSEAEESKQLECIMVPGNIIDCKNEANEQIDCILIAATSAQAEFSCRKNKEQSLDNAANTPTEDGSELTNNEPNNLINETARDDTETNIYRQIYDFTSNEDKNTNIMPPENTNVFNNARTNRKQQYALPPALPCCD